MSGCDSDSSLAKNIGPKVKISAQVFEATTFEGSEKPSEKSMLTKNAAIRLPPQNRGHSLVSYIALVRVLDDDGTIEEEEGNTRKDEVTDFAIRRGTLLRMYKYSYFVSRSRRRS